MAQFDVYKNRNTSTRKHYPLLVDVQHSVLESLSTRIVIPLASTGKNAIKPMDVLTPLIEFDDISLVLMTPQISAIAVKSLYNPVGTLAPFRARIIAAMDFAFTGY